MTKFYTRGATRMYSWPLIEAWAEAEESLGLKNSIFFVEEQKLFDTCRVTQWVDAEEGEKFFEEIKKLMKIPTWFDTQCEFFFHGLKEKDKLFIFTGLAIFNEIDEHPEIANEDQLRRLKRIRETTHEEIYKLQ